MVDVERRVRGAPGTEEVHERFEGALLRGKREVAVGLAGPEGVERTVGLEDAEEVVEAVIEGVWVPLDIEEEVVRGGRWEAGEAALRVDRGTGTGEKELVPRLPGEASLELDPRLLPDPGEGAATRGLERRAERQLEAAEICQRRRSAFDQGSTLAGRDPGHEAEVVVGPPPSNALRRPPTDVAMLDRVRVGVLRRIHGRGFGGHRPEESVPGRAVVGHEVVDPQALHEPGAAAQRHVHPPRPHALDGFEEVHVDAHLEDGAGLDVAGELRIGDLVVVRPEP